MITAINLFDSTLKKQLDSIQIDTIVYERHDDGFLLECTVNGSEKKNLEVDFYQWKFLVNSIKDAFFALQVESLVDDMVRKVDWIAELPIRKMFGKSIIINSNKNNNQLRAISA